MKHLLRAMAKEAKIEKAVSDSGKNDQCQEFPGGDLSVTYHSMEIQGKTLKFKATAGYMDLYDEKHQPVSKVFYISYEKTGVDKDEKRPVTFAFNGGPGASSAWVHFGAMGPKRVKLNQEGRILPPPYVFEDNEYTWLEFTDLVFIDPIGTGFSYHGHDEDPKKFYGVQEDVSAAGEFIRLYITRNHRWLSPKFIAGESYGTFRAAALADYLQNQYAMDTNGIIFISSALNYMTFDFDSGADLPYILILPTYTATAWYHNRLEPALQEDLKKTLREVEEWAINTYSVALLKGDSLPESEKTEIIKTLSRYTGLSEEMIEECSMRIHREYFIKKLLKDERKIVGVYDGRLKAWNLNPSFDDIKTDPSKFNVFGACIAAMNAYLRDELKYENDKPYHPISRQASKLWNWNSGIEGRMGYVNVTDKVAQVVSYNPYFKVFFASGYYDICTPYFINHYTVNHLGLSPELRENITLKDYEGGHMMYVHLPSRIRLFEDVKAYVESCVDQEIVDG